MSSQLIIEEKACFDRLIRKGKIAELSYSSYLKIYHLIGLVQNRKRNLKLLDIGCGRGVHSCHFAKMGFRVTAIDISPEAIKYAKKKSRQEGVEVRFLLGDAARTKLPRDSFDIVVFIDSLHHFYYPGLDKMINEAKRVLRKKGVMILIEPNHLNPYTNLSYTIAHFFRVNKVINIRHFDQVITVNERSLNPFRLLGILKNDFEVAAFKFFPYTLLYTKKSLTGSQFLRKLEIVVNTICFVLPQPFRYDHFGLKLIKK